MRQAPELPLTLPLRPQLCWVDRGGQGRWHLLWVDSTVVLIQCWGLCKLAFLRHGGNKAVAAPGVMPRLKVTCTTSRVCLRKYRSVLSVGGNRCMIALIQ